MSTNYPSESTDVQPRTRVYKNGAVFDMDKGRIVANPGGGKQAFTSDTAALAVQRREELKHQAVIDAANLVVNMDARNSNIPEVKALVGDDMAYIKAIAMGRTKAAMDSDSPYGNAAANWIVDNSGQAESKQPQVSTVQHVISLDTGQAARIAALLADMSGQSGQLIGIISNDDDVVDVQAQDMGAVQAAGVEDSSADDGGG